MTTLHDLLEAHVRADTLPGAVGLVARGDQVEVVAVGGQDVGDGAPMARDSIFRVASITKSVTAAALLILVEEGTIALDDPIGTWLPELGKPVVVRTPASPVDDVVPADRPISVFDVLASQAGYGFASDFTLPAVRELSTVQKDGRVPSNFPPADEWMAALGRIPLLYQPGAAWLYDTCSVLQGVLISRVTGQPLPEFRGNEYTSDELRCDISRLGLRQSVGRTGSCFDNAAAESFFAPLKGEIGTRCWPDRLSARAEIFAFIESFYNRRRLRKHPGWGYLTPLEIQQRHEQGHALTA